MWRQGIHSCLNPSRKQMVGPQGVTKVGRAQGSQRGVAIATVGALHPVSQGASREVGTASQDPSLQHMDGAKQQQRSGRKGPWSHPVPAWLLPALRQLHPQGSQRAQGRLCGSKGQPHGWVQSRQGEGGSEGKCKWVAQDARPDRRL